MQPLRFTSYQLNNELIIVKNNLLTNKLKAFWSLAFFFSFIFFCNQRFIPPLVMVLTTIALFGIMVVQTTIFNKEIRCY